MFLEISESVAYLRQEYYLGEKAEPESELRDNLDTVVAVEELKGGCEYSSVGLIGCGPGVVIHLLPFLGGKVERILLTDYSQVNLKVTEKFTRGWLDSLWQPYFEAWTNGNETQARQLLKTIQHKLDIETLDLYHPEKSSMYTNKVEAAVVPFVVESITDNQTDFRQLLANVSTLASEDVYYICLLNSSSWGTSTGGRYSSYPLTLATLEENLRAVGYTDIESLRTETIDHADWNGYGVVRASV